MSGLRAVWDFDDLDGSERRFRVLLDAETGAVGRAVILSQLARIQGLRARFDDAEALLDEADGMAGARAETLIERGRLRRSSGDREAALLLFVTAFEAAQAEGDGFMAADAAHMAALAETGRGMERWTERGLEIAEADPDARYWRGPLLNNLGWHRFERGDHVGALAAFELALKARQEQPEREYEIEIARYAVGKTLRMLRRPSEAAELLEQAVAWTGRAGRPDAWFHEELAEDYAALGRADDAREQARLALELLDESDERSERLRELAGLAAGS